MRWLKRGREFPGKYGVTRNLALAQGNFSFLRDAANRVKHGAEAMSLLVLDFVLWIAGIRGHIPRNDGFPVGRSDPSFGASSGALLRVLVVAAAVVASLSLALWAAVWLAIKLL